MEFSSLLQAFSPVVRGVEILFHGLRWFGLIVFYPFVWAHERTHYAAARPWRLETSYMETWTLEPRAMITYDLEETPRWALRFVGLAPTLSGYLMLGAGFVLVGHVPVDIWIGSYLGLGWVLYTVPSKGDVLPHVE